MDHDVLDHDVLDRVRAAAPTSAELETAWPTFRRDDTMLAARSRDEHTLVRRSARRRRSPLVPAAAAAVVIVTAGVAVLASRPDGSGDPAAASPSVPSSPSLPSSPATASAGSISYSLLTTYQRSGSTYRPTGTVRTWVTPDGRTWSVGNGNCYRFPAPSRPGLARPTEAWVASLPTDPVRLNAYLRNAYAGTDAVSTDANVFGFYSLLEETGGLTTAELRQAFVAVLERTPSVRVTRSVTPLGIPAVRADLPNQQANSDRDIQSAFFDPDNGSLIGWGRGVRAATDLYMFNKVDVTTVVALPAALRTCTPMDN